MIDLHTHTKYSDGTDDIYQLLSNATKNNIRVLSVTDHNSVDCYYEMELFDINDYYDGSIITGCEFTSVYNDTIIEILGYGFDYKEIKIFLDKYYSKEMIDENTRTLYLRLMNKINKYGLRGNFVDRSEDTFESEMFIREIYNELARHPENKDILGEDIFGSLHDFYRLGVSNKESKLYISPGEFRPEIEEVINAVHEARGICFLAHPYQYMFEEPEITIGKIFDTYEFDGIECYYTTFSVNQMAFLRDFAERRKLLVSGGSDYHGTNKVNHNLGTGRGNLEINANLLRDWKVSYFKK